MVDNMSTQNDGNSVVSSMPKYPSVVERYFTEMYKIDPLGNKEQDHCILVHSNRICIVTLANSHPIIACKKTVTSVDFAIDKKTNRLDNRVSGKSKRGAQIMSPGSVLCIVTCGDNSQYSIYSCIRGSLMEVNECLIKSPHLLSTQSKHEGYIAIVLPKVKTFEDEMATLLTAEQYRSSLLERQTNDADAPPNT